MTSGERLQEIGREIVFASLGVIRTMQTHGADNQALVNALSRLGGLVNAGTDSEEGLLRLHIVDDMLLLNGVRLRPKPMETPHFKVFIDLFIARGIGGVAFTPPIEIDPLRRWFLIIADRAAAERDPSVIRAQLEPLAEAGIQALDLRTITTKDTHDTLRVSTMAFAMQTYARALLGFREFIDAVRAGRDPYANRLGVIRVVQDLVDIASSRADHLFQIMRLQKTRGAALGCPYPEVHGANTCVYAILLGLMLRLDRTALLDLGSSALLAGAGAVLGDGGIAAKRGVLSAEEKRRIQEQMVRGAQALLGREPNDDSVMLRAIAAYEHRRGLIEPDGTPSEPLHLVSMIVALASAYDAMTTDRPWRAAMSADAALGTLHAESGTKFDPLLVSTLATLVGVYPRLVAPDLES